MIFNVVKAMVPKEADIYGPIMETVLSNYSITTPLRVAHFLAQVMHESGNFKYLEENLNYNKEALLRVFSKYFTPALAEKCHRNPVTIANIVYSNRMGNGDIDSGDGWRYRGRGLIQLTGRTNYVCFSNAVNMDIVTNPDTLVVPELAVESACWYWETHELNELADNDDIVGITRRINGGTHGIQQRTNNLSRIKQELSL